MSKVAKLVMISLLTRVIVDENATDEQILQAAKPQFKAKLDNNELMDNLESIKPDTELPYSPEIDEAYLDKDGMALIEGQTVLVDDPTGDDLHQHSFLGQVKGFRYEYVIVVDGEGDCFDVEPYKLLIQE